MQFIAQKPNVTIEIKRPDYKAPAQAPKILYSFDAQDAGSLAESKVKGFSFSDRIDYADGRFALELYPLADNAGRTTWLDLLKPRDMVYFHLNGKLRFIGVIDSCALSSAVTDDQVSLNCLVNGFGVGGLLARFAFTLDSSLYPDILQKGRFADAASENEKALSQLNQSVYTDSSLKEAVGKLIDAFLNLAGRVSQTQGGGLAYFIESLYRLDIEEALKPRFPLELNFFSYGQNSLWRILESLFPAPLYELFGRIDSASGKYALTMRETPFSFAAWNNLELHEIDPLLLKSFSLEKSGQEAFSYYLAGISGTSYSRAEQTMLSGATLDNDAWALYGHRPLIAESRFVSASGASAMQESPKEINSRLSGQLKEHYEHNDSMYSGRLAMAFYEDEARGISLPRIGDRISFLGGQFYVNETTVTMNAGSPLQSVLGLCRGYVYGDTPKTCYKGPLQNMGKALAGLARGSGRTKGD